MIKIEIPFHYPGDDEYVALATRMRIAGAWDPQNDWLVRTDDPTFNRSYYGQFINDCVGYMRTNRSEVAVATYDYWVTCDSLQQRGFRSVKEYHAYVVRKL
jgi:hypothetical protein